ncbi:MarR family transcriptional regulator [Lutibacter sp.]|uniref:MarR family winged helix-turn-helix transcriptional regulator n=1 Tax=Lutibacter sp. TaxID=1925666 RepID=UPI0025C3F7E8|nr:MarR family transcriptional regulator [Lutibacter sp.]MCF6182169.1 MarR family transcriptional regulator [Lutibacter sp.]
MKENIEISNLLMDIPTVLCRNISQRFVSTILKEIKSEFSKHHFMILKLLSENKKLYITEIVQTLGITKPQMTVSIDKLISLGFVVRKNDIKDRRKIYLKITKSGRKINNTIKQEINSKINENLIQFSESEIDQLENGLKILYKFCTIYK